MNNQLLSKVATSACLTCFLLGASVNAYAWGVPSLGGDSSSSVDTGELVKTSQKMVKNYTSALKTIAYAQSEAFLAVGEGKKAEEALQTMKVLEGGNLDEDELAKETANTQKREKEVNKIGSNQKKLQGGAREHLAKAAAGYAGASYAGVKILEAIKPWGSEATDAMSALKTDPMKLNSFKNDVDPGLHVLSKLPELSSSWVTTSSKLIDYAKINGDSIDTKKASEAFGDL